LKGKRFEATDRHGKYVFVCTGEAPWLALHFGMTGYLEYERERQPGRYDRVLFDFENGYSLAYLCQRLLGKVTLTESPGQFTEDNDLGPDALEIGRADFSATVQEAGATVKSCLMNQRRVAGIGNIYSDEILFHSHLPPQRKSDTLSEKEVGQLHRQMRYVLALAVDRKADPAQVPVSWLLPHRHKGGTCPRCAGKIRKESVAGRSAFWCPKCQQD
jgi:formamidopyrimidine-DNA glycosylase